MTEKSVQAIVLAAGEGSRMRSSLPKPLHRLCGRPMVLHVLDAIFDAGVDHAVMVVGFGVDAVVEAVDDGKPDGLRVTFVEQLKQLGTGDATTVGLSGFTFDDNDDDDLLVVPGDTPLVRGASLRALIGRHRDAANAATLLSAMMDDPTGYGRVVRDEHGRVIEIIEQADASESQRAIQEVGTSIYCFQRGLLASSLRELSPNNAQGEFYLTDVIGVLATANHRVDACVVDDPSEVAGVNDRIQLARVQEILRNAIATKWMASGVTIIDPSRVYIDSAVQVCRDVTLYPDVVLEGETHIGEGSIIGPNCQLVDTVVGASSVIRHTVATSAIVGSNATVGPFGVLEPGSVVGHDATVGPYFALARLSSPSL